MENRFMPHAVCAVWYLTACMTEECFTTYPTNRVRANVPVTRPCKEAGRQVSKDANQIAFTCHVYNSDIQTT